MKSTRSSKKIPPNKKPRPSDPEQEQLLQYVSKFKEIIISASNHEEPPKLPAPPKFHGRLVSNKSRSSRAMRQSRDSRVVNYFNDTEDQLDAHDRVSRRSRNTQKSRVSSRKSRELDQFDDEMLGDIDRSLGGSRFL